MAMRRDQKIYFARALRAVGAAEAAISESGTRSCFRTRTKGLERERFRMRKLNSASDYALIKKLVTNRIDAIRHDLQMCKHKGGHLPSATFYRRAVYSYLLSRLKPRPAWARTVGALMSRVPGTTLPVLRGHGRQPKLVTGAVVIFYHNRGIYYHR